MVGAAGRRQFDPQRNRLPQLHQFGRRQGDRLHPVGNRQPGLGRHRNRQHHGLRLRPQRGYAVGTWPDNPYFGKQPFDNTEQDDYSPIKNVRIYRNSYLSPCDLLCIRPTNFISDCGIRSSGTFQNGNFEHGRAYWTMRGDAGVRDGCGYADGGRLYEGLYLTRGRHTSRRRYRATDRFYADRLSLFEESVPIARADFSSETWTQRTLTVDIP